MNIDSIIQHNKTLKHIIFENHKELRNIQNRFWDELNISDYININNTKIATGHQPIFYYPGILIKNYYAGKLAAEAGGAALNFVVDSDTGKIEIPVPCKNEHGLCKTHVSIKNDQNTVFSGFQPSGKDADRFFSEIENYLNTLGNDFQQIQTAFQQYKQQFLQTFEIKELFIDTANSLRAEFESALGIKLYDLKVSDISKTKAYNLFIYYIIKNIESFCFHYNKAIYQNKNKDYQPVKEACKMDGLYELPFWLIKDDVRYPVFGCITGDKMLHFYSPEINYETKISVAGMTVEQIAAKMSKTFTLYPKATILTIMIRLFFSDLFIHGTGGVEYEKVNNIFMQSFFGLHSKLQFKSATGNIYLPLEKNLPTPENIQKDYHVCQKCLRKYNQKPEDLLSPELADKYKKEKKRIGSQMKETPPGKRKELNDQIANINEKMREHLKEKYNQTTETLSNIKRILNKKNVYMERCYPYFIYPQGYLSVEKLDESLKINIY